MGCVPRIFGLHLESLLVRKVFIHITEQIAEYLSALLPPFAFTASVHQAVNRLQQFLVFPVYQLVARHQIGRQFVFHLNDLLCIIFWI